MRSRYTELCKIAHGRSCFEAQLIKTLLEAAGIPNVWIRNSWELLGQAGVEVFVPGRYWLHAERVLQEARRLGRGMRKRIPVES